MLILKKHILIVAIFLPIILYSQNGKKQSYIDIYQEANKLYESGNFEEAASLYKEVMLQTQDFAPAYYNIGNCYYKVNEIGLAILNYERALKLNPGYKDAAYNLSIANALTKDNIQPVNDLFIAQWWRKAASAMPYTYWMVMHIALFFATLAAVLLFLLKRKLRSKLAWLHSSILALLLSLLFLGLGIQRHHDTCKRKQIVILSQTTTLMSSPGEKSSILTEYHEGTKLNVIREIQDWYEVETHESHKGWISAFDAEAI